MAKKNANNYRLWIETAVPGTYAEIKGQQDLTINREAQQIDTSTKDDGAYGTSMPGLRTLTIDCAIIPDLPDANGYALLEAGALASPQEAVNFQVRKDGSSGDGTTDVVFEASMWIGNFSTGMARNDAVKVNFNLTLAAVPVTDALA